ncbi:MAG: molybdopterin-dependent oxidoreductase [Novosphingobium sp.]|nr:molybdopterin-dependent oxidoreductase [Novosphingobium sp.]
MGIDIQPSTCRACSAYCPVLVTTDTGKVLQVTGNPEVPMYGGFTCPKGRALPALHDHPERLLTSMKRQADGSYTPIATDVAIAEIAEKLGPIVERGGPRSVAGFLGNPGVEQIATAPVMLSLLRAIGSPMFFTMATLDQPNIPLADAMHGAWDGGRMRPETLDVFLIAGGNPVISKQYFGQNPGMRLKKLVRSGCKLIVVDPRRSETARRAAVHLQPIPGQDEVVVAGLIHLVIAMGGVDAEFVAGNATGLAELSEAVRPFTPDYVASRAGVVEDDLRAAAKLIAEAKRANFATGTGLSMTGRGTLATYLYNCLQTLRGFWAREGDEMLYSPVLLPPAAPCAQPCAPTPTTGFGEKMRVRGLEQSPAGMPAAALIDEILMPGEGQVRAVFMHAGAMRTMPEEARTHEALRSLDLLVTHDIEMSPTARVSDYVIASTLGFEIPVLSFLVELNSSLHKGYGYPDPYAAAQPALVEPPAGADVIDAWRLYYRLGQKLGFALECGSMFAEKGAPLDMDNEPDTEDIHDLIAAGSAVPLERIKQYPAGHVFEEARVHIAPRDPDCDDKLDLANAEMLADLAEVAGEDIAVRRGTGEQYPLLMIPKRMQNVTNGTMRLDAKRLRVMTNPAFLHPSELAAHGLAPGDLAQVRSRHGVIEAVVEADEDLRPGVLAIAHGFGLSPEEQADPRKHGSNVNRLTALDDDYDRYSGMPRMGAIPVSLTALPAA